MFLVVVDVHTQLDGPSEKVSKAEDEIATRLANELNDKSIPYSSLYKILELTRFKLIAVKTGRSIVLYIWCEMEKELLRLHDLLTTGRLKDIVGQFFNQLLAHSQKVAVNNITINDGEFKRMKAYFAGNQLFKFHV